MLSVASRSGAQHGLARLSRQSSFRHFSGMCFSSRASPAFARQNSVHLLGCVSEHLTLDVAVGVGRKVMVE
jgi:hypothetical protein